MCNFYMGWDMPVIGLSSGILTVEHQMPGLERAYVNRDYVQAVEKAGGIPVILPVTENEGIAVKQLAVCKGLIMTGGVDIHPSFYGEEPNTLLGEYSLEMDRHQSVLLKAALEKDIPVLCICRGMQLLNVVCGGTLYQDVSKAGNVICHLQKSKRWEYCHSVTISSPEASSRGLLEGLLGKIVQVNSFHHQSVKQCGSGLTVTAVASDGIVEAIEMTGKKFVLGVQWHPEMLLLKNDSMLTLFKALIEKCS